MDEMFYFYNVLDLNNQKILWLPSIYQFERTGINLNHPTQHYSKSMWTHNWNEELWVCTEIECLHIPISLLWCLNIWGTWYKQLCIEPWQAILQRKGPVAKLGLGIHSLEYQWSWFDVTFCIFPLLFCLTLFSY